MIGPFFFETAINAERYREIVELFIASLEPHEKDCRFQQDGTTARTTNTTMTFVKEFIGERIIFRPI